MISSPFRRSLSTVSFELGVWKSRLTRFDSQGMIHLMVAIGNRYEKIKDDALHLPLAERSRLASRLLESLDEDDDVSEEWLEEIRRRASALDDGTSQLTPHDQVMAEVNEGLARIRAARQP